MAMMDTVAEKSKEAMDMQTDAAAALTVAEEATVDAESELADTEADMMEIAPVAIAPDDE